MEVTIPRSIAKFALQFCNELEKGKTTVCSPLSAETVLALTALGCRGQTQAELLQALDLPDDKAVAENTEGKIKEIASADTLGDRTSLFLVNAFYFKAFWDEPFKKIHTKNRKFHVDNATTVEVPMMYMKDKFMNYGSNTKLKAKFLEMPYRCQDSHMVIVLPDDIEGLNGVMQQLAAGHDLMADIEAMEKGALDITIPTFKAETTIDVKDLLKKMGVERIFDGTTSEIDMLTSPERLYVSQAVQKAYIMVNEVGTIASATTGCILIKCSKQFPRPRIPFTADRPFLFLLKACRIPVFVGVYRGGQETIPSAAELSKATGLSSDDEQDSDLEF